MLTLSATAALLGGRHLGRDIEFTSVGTDSRTIIPGMLFVALAGDRFDGHDYVPTALAQGAAAALVSEAWAAAHAARPENLPLIAVADPHRALGQLAAHWRIHWRDNLRGQIHGPLIGITGSNGKTTVKEMCAAILQADFGQNAVLATRGNFNNDIGLPLTLLRLRASHAAAVVEMGMNHPGEIAYLTALARPTVALVNNAQRAHLAGLGTITEVARAKGEIFAGLDAHGVAVINANDPHAPLWREMNAGRTVLSFGLDGAAINNISANAAMADIHGRWRANGLASELSLVTPLGDATLHLPAPGEHNARNALAAAAACIGAGVPLAPIVRGLEQFANVTGRLEKKQGIRSATVIDDSYNANPDSMRAAIDVLATLPGKRIFIMGDMGEVGDTGGQLHSEIGGHAKSMGIEHLLTLGELSAAASHDFGSGAQHFSSVDALVKAVRPLLDSATTVLVKGSRFMKMERVVAQIVAQPLEETHAA